MKRSGKNKRKLQDSDIAETGLSNDVQKMKISSETLQPRQEPSKTGPKKF